MCLHCTTSSDPVSNVCFNNNLPKVECDSEIYICKINVEIKKKKIHEFNSYFPMQKSRKMTSSICSVFMLPVIKPIHRIASRKCCAHIAKSTFSAPLKSSLNASKCSRQLPNKCRCRSFVSVGLSAEGSPHLSFNSNALYGYRILNWWVPAANKQILTVSLKLIRYELSLRRFQFLPCMKY